MERTDTRLRSNLLGAVQLDAPHWPFAQHNEHRIVVPRLIYVIDRFLFGSTNKFSFFCNGAVQLSLAALITCIALRATPQRIAEKIWIVGAVLALLFSAIPWFTRCRVECSFAS
jgi:hypothetical protein